MRRLDQWRAWLAEAPPALALLVAAILLAIGVGLVALALTLGT